MDKLNDPSSEAGTDEQGFENVAMASQNTEAAASHPSSLHSVLTSSVLYLLVFRGFLEAVAYAVVVVAPLLLILGGYWGHVGRRLVLLPPSLQIYANRLSSCWKILLGRQCR